MKASVAVAGHITIDKIGLPSKTIQSIGGPPCYAGLSAKRFCSGVTLVTKIGRDFPEEQIVWLSRNQLHLQEPFRSPSSLTTRFEISPRLNRRVLRLKARCEPLAIEQLSSLKGSSIIISPVCGEISHKFLIETRKRFDVIYLDPQGFLRTFDSEGFCRLRKPKEDFLSLADIVKADLAEARLLGGKQNRERNLRRILFHGPKVVISTNGQKDVMIAFEGKIYLIPVRRVRMKDSTGLGDIFAGAFLPSYLKEEDPLWATSVAVSMSGSAEGVGLAKIPEVKSIIEGAEAIYGEAKRIS